MNNLEQQGEKWLNWRKIGSSDCPVILDISPYKTAYQLCNEKMGLVAPQDATAVMIKGKETEKHIREQFEAIVGQKFSPACIESETYEWMTASLDGLSEDGTIFAEFKMNNDAYHMLAKMGEIVEHHYAQVMHQWICGGSKIKKGYYVSWNKGDMAIVEIMPPEENTILVNGIIETEANFWECLKSKIPPPLSARDYETFDDAEAFMLLEEYNRAKQAEDEACKRKDKFKELLLKKVGYRNAKIGDHKVTKVVRAGNVDYARIPQLDEVDLEQYRKEPNVSFRIN